MATFTSAQKHRIDSMIRRRFEDIYANLDRFVDEGGASEADIANYIVNWDLSEGYADWLEEAS